METYWSNDPIRQYLAMQASFMAFDELSEAMNTQNGSKTGRRAEKTGSDRKGWQALASAVWRYCLG